MIRRQCKLCPWRVDVDPNDIPNGYCTTKHANLRNTIAKPGELRFSGPLRMMACHETMPSKELACVGWLAHQLGPGNNLTLRLRAMSDKTLTDFELVGEQRARFEDTLPEEC